MSALAYRPIPLPLLARARADQVSTLYGQWHRTTLSMVLGAALLCIVLWQEAAVSAMVTWVGAILANQAWRGGLVAAYRRNAPAISDAARWGTYWSLGSTLAGGLWGAAAVVMFPASHSHQALLIVCVFSVVLGGLNLTAVYKPAFYGFVISALVPLVIRVAFEADQVHLFTALVMLVVLVFVLAYGHHLNDLLTQSLAMRYENTDLIAELKSQTTAAESARSAAELANRAKSQFLAAASHDLRQPLHALGLFAAALAARACEPTIQPLVRSIHASVEALETLFGQLLDLSRLEAGALHPRIEAVAVGPLLSRVAREFAPAATAAGLVLRVRPSSTVVRSDAVLLERVLRNLVANALRYTRRGGVLVGVRPHGTEARLDVVDTGVGIAPGDQERIFAEFVQLECARASERTGRGMGLGLAIVRRLCGLLAHPILLRSTPGRGSRFSIVMPRAMAPGRTHDAPAPAVAGVHDAPRADWLAERTVVVIDDDPAVIAAMQALFSTWGARVIAGEEPRQAIEALRRECGARRTRADLIVADLRLANGGCGIAAVEAVRDASWVLTPALIISGDTTDSARRAAADAGIELLQKPVVAAALLAAAERAVCGRSAHEPEVAGREAADVREQVSHVG